MPSETKNDNGNGMTVLTAKWILGIAQAIILVLIIGIGSTLLSIRDDQVLMKADLIGLQRTMDCLEIPPSWFVERVTGIEDRLNHHLESTGGSEQ